MAPAGPLDCGHAQPPLGLGGVIGRCSTRFRFSLQPLSLLARLALPGAGGSATAAPTRPWGTGVRKSGREALGKIVGVGPRLERIPIRKLDAADRKGMAREANDRPLIDTKPLMKTLDGPEIPCSTSP